MIRKILKKFTLYSLGLLVCLLLIIQIPKINTQIIQYIMAKSLPGGMYATIQGVQGEFPFNIKIHSLNIVDEHGQWLSVKDLKFSWVAANLIAGKIDISKIGAAQVDMKRLPVYKEAKKTAASTVPFFLPIKVEEFFVDCLKIAPWFSGQVKLHGEGNVHRLDALNFSLFLETVDQPHHGEDDLFEIRGKLEGKKVKLVVEGSDSLTRLKTIDPERASFLVHGDYEVSLEVEANLDGSQAIGHFNGAINNLATTTDTINQFLGDQLDWNFDLHQPSLVSPLKVEGDLSTANYTKMITHGIYHLDTQEYKLNTEIDFPEIEHLLLKDSPHLAGDLKGSIEAWGFVEKDHHLQWYLSGLHVYQNQLKEFSGKAVYENQQGAFDVKMIYPSFSTQLSGKLKVEEGNCRFQQLLLKGNGHQAQGRGIFNTTTSTIEEGELQWQFTTLQPLGRFFNTSLKGSVKGDLHLKNNHLSAEVKAKQLGYEDLDFKEVQLTFDGHNKENFKLFFKADQGHYQLKEIPHADLKINCHNGQGTFSHTLNAPHTHLGTAGAFFIDNQDWDVTVKNLSVIHHAQPYLKLLKPLQVTGNPAQVKVAANTLKLYTGAVHFSDLVFGQINEGTLKLIDVSPKLLEFLPKGYELAGQINGQLTFGAQQDSPFVEGKLNLKDIYINNQLRKTRKSLSLITNFSYHQHNWLFDLTYQDTSSSHIKMKGNIESSSFLPDVHSSIDLQAKGIIDLSILNSFIWWGDRIKGKLKIDLNTSNTFFQLHHQGSFSLQDITYENADFGTVLRSLNLNALIQGPLIQITSLSGKDFAQGTFTGKGTINIKNLQKIQPNLSLLLDKMLIVNNDITSLNVSGHLDIKPYAEGSILLAGDIQTNFGDIFLEDSVQQIKNIHLTEITEKSHWRRKDLKKIDVTPSKSVYDLIVRVPNNLYIQGRNLKSRWEGNLLVKGALNMPTIEGQLLATQGRADIIGKQMKVREGSKISFQTENGEVEPVLDIRVEKTIRDVLTTIWVHGGANNPKIEFVSIPALSQEEVVSLLLFGKPLNSVSAAQSLQLATRIAAIKTGEKGVNIIDQFQQAFGLDEFSVGASEAAEEGNDDQSSVSKGYAVKVGKQLNEKIYFGVEQGLGGETGTKAIVNVDVTKNTKVNLEAGPNDRSVGYMWEKRY